MKGKTYKIERDFICTTNKILIIGGEYLYKEGQIVEKIILEAVKKSVNSITLRIYLPKQNKTDEIFQRTDNQSIPWMWQIYDWNEDAKNTISKFNILKKNKMETNNLKQKQTKKNFFDLLNEDIYANILIHFNKIYECTKLEERELNMVWLSWLIGEGLLSFNDALIQYDKNEIEFYEEDYEITIESEMTGGYNFPLLNDYYSLDSLYREVLKNMGKKQ